MVPELPRSRADHQLSLSRGHLHALGALALALAFLAFFLGYQVGRRQVPEAPVAVAAPLVSEETRNGNLEVLLNKVDETSAKNLALSFPANLPGGAEAAPSAPTEPAPTGDGAVPPANVPPPTEGPVPTGGWALQIGDTHDYAEAQAWMRPLTDAGLAAYRTTEIRDGVPTHRLRVGGYAAQKDAADAVALVAPLLGKESLEVVPAP